jgi:hypothetical protein
LLATPVTWLPRNRLIRSPVVVKPPNGFKRSFTSLRSRVMAGGQRPGEPARRGVAAGQAWALPASRAMAARKASAFRAAATSWYVPAGELAQEGLARRVDVVADLRRRDRQDD